METKESTKNESNAAKPPVLPEMQYCHVCVMGCILKGFMLLHAQNPDKYYSIKDFRSMLAVKFKPYIIYPESLQNYKKGVGGMM